MSKPLMPPGATPMFWVAVVGCFVFWLAAYVLIIRIGFKQKTFGMPVAALCANIVWEVVFSHIIAPEVLLIQIGNTAWAVLDIFILVTIWRYAQDDFEDPWVRRFLRPMIVIGIAGAFLVMIPFAKVYGDMRGYYLGWAAALMMSILFIAMLRRRGSSKGQSFYIAVCMFLGNVSAFLWVRYYPNITFSQTINGLYLLTTGFFNIVYIVMIYQQCRKEGINPWRHW